MGIILLTALNALAEIRKEQKRKVRRLLKWKNWA